MRENQNGSIAIIFDLGGVLLDWDPRHLYRRYFNGDHEAMEQFLAEVCPQEWNEQQDAGYPFAKAIAERIALFPEHAELIQAYDTHWEEMVAGPIQPAVEILSSLKQAGYPLYALSNWSAEKFNLVRPTFDFLNWFDLLLISGEVGLKKPDPRIYTTLLERINRPAADCLFIDDAPRNVAAAEALGFQTILYRSAEQLETELKTRGILF